MEDLSAIKKTLDGASGKALKRYLLSRLYELRDIESIQEFQTTASQTLELKAQKRAYNKLKEIMRDLLSIDEEPEKRDPRDYYDA